MLFSFLDTKAHRKMKLFSILQTCEAQYLTAARLSQLAGFSYRMTASLLMELQEELEEIFGKPLMNELGKIIWDANLFQRQGYHQYLIQQSIPYRFLLFTLSEPAGNLELFCQQNYLSLTSARRALKPLQEYVQGYRVRLNLSGAYFQGKESVIRLLYFNFLWLASSGKSLLIRYQELEPALYEEIRLISLYCRNPQEAAVYLTISLMRIREGYFVESLAMAPVETPLLMAPLETLFQRRVRDLLLLDQEVCFALFEIYYKAYFIDPYDQHTLEVERIFQKLLEKEHPVAITCEAFCLELDQQLLSPALGLEEKKLIQLNLFNLFMAFYLLGEALPSMKDLIEDSFFLEQDMVAKVKKPVIYSLRKLAKSVSTLDLDLTQSPMADLIVSVLIPYLKQGRVKLQVGIIPLPNYHKMQELVLFLQQLNFINVNICYTQQENVDVDIVILNYGTELPFDKPYLFASQDRDVAFYYKELFAVLSDLYQTKLKKAITS